MILAEIAEALGIPEERLAEGIARCRFVNLLRNRREDLLLEVFRRPGGPPYVHVLPHRETPR